MENMTKPQIIRVCDGVNLRVICTDRFKSVRTGIYFILPADKHKAPILTLLRGVLMRGCEKYPSIERLNIALDELYGTTVTMRNFLDGDRQVISFNCEMLDSRYANFDGEGGADILGGTLDVLRQLLLFPLLENGLLRPDIVEREKEYQCDTIRDDLSDTAAYTKEAFRKTMCADEPYGVSLLGDVDHVQSITPEQLTAGWRELLSEATVEIFYVGSESAQSVERAMHTAFDGTPVFTPKINKNYRSNIHMSQKDANFVSEDKPISQSKLMLGWRYEGETGLADYCSAVVLCELLGVMQSSLLYTHVRERLGLCYYCGASLEPSKWILAVSCGTEPSKRQTATDEILRIFKEIQDGVLSDEVLTLARRSLENYLRQIPDGAGAMEGFYLARALEGGERENITPREFFDLINNVTKDDVIRASRGFVLDTVYFLNATDACGE